MSHEILQTVDGKASIIYTGQLPWHKLGEKVPLKITATEAMEKIGSGYEIIKVPNCAPHPDGVTDDFVLVSGQTLFRPPLPQYGLTDWEEFGQVSADYVPIHTRMIATLLDEKDAKTKKSIVQRWPIATHGIVSSGTRMFFSLDGGQFEVHGSPVQGYVNIRDTKTGKGAFEISVGGVRIVCRNTFDQAGSSRWVSADIRHVGEIEHEIRVRLAMIAQAQDAMNRMRDECVAMADTAITDAQVKKLLEKTYPGKTPTRTFQLAKSLEASGKEEMFKNLYGVDLAAYLEANGNHDDQIMLYRAGVLTAYQQYNSNDENEAHGTAWAYFNGVTAYVDHEQTIRGTEASRVLYKAFGKGSEAKDRAYAASVALAASN